MLIGPIVVSAAVYFIVGPVLGLGVMGAALLALEGYNIYQVSRQWKALDDPARGESENTLGPWGDIHYRLHRLVRRSCTQVQQAEQYALHSGYPGFPQWRAHAGRFGPCRMVQ